MPYFGGLGICKYNGKYLLELTGNACGDNYYYGTKKDGSVGLVHKFIWDATEKVVSLVSQGVKYVQKCSLIIKYC